MRRLLTLELHPSSSNSAGEESLVSRAARGASRVPGGANRDAILSVARRALPLACALLVVFATLAAPAVSSAQMAVGVSVSFGPPAIPVYAQPPCPGPSYIWTPGYWAWDPADGYYWVPGTWVMAPFVGALWTPGYWGWNNGAYLWTRGYWGLTVGFYGGINYGFGYTGYGYGGGYWNRGAFYYNRTVNNIRTTNITNVYNKTVVNNVSVNRVSYNGGPGGVTVQPTASQLAASRARRAGPVAAQTLQESSARSNRQQWASVNHGRPAVAATPKPGAFSSSSVVRASRAGAPYHAPAAHAAKPSAASRTPNPAGGGTRPLISARGNNTQHANHAQPTPSSRTRAQAPLQNASRTPSTRNQAPVRNASRPTPPRRTQVPVRKASRAPQATRPPSPSRPYRSTNYQPRPSAAVRRQAVGPAARPAARPGPAPHATPQRQQAPAPARAPSQHQAPAQHQERRPPQ